MSTILTLATKTYFVSKTSVLGAIIVSLSLEFASISVIIAAPALERRVSQQLEVQQPPLDRPHALPVVQARLKPRGHLIARLTEKFLGRVECQHL